MDDVYGGFVSAGEWLLMVALMLAGWTAIAALALWWARAGRRDDGRSARTLLAERLARGEIDEEEFTRRTGLLRRAEEADGGPVPQHRERET